MVEIFESIAEYSYLGIMLLLVAVNAAPVLMPPTWIVLSSFYLVDPALDPLLLAMAGATGATAGRMILKWASTHFRRLASSDQREGLDAINGYLGRKRFGYLCASFLFAATPLPSNMLFVAYGLMRAKNLGIYAGFWAGRVISYYIMISISSIVLQPFLQLFEERYIGILAADAAGIGMVVLFASIDWKELMVSRRIRFIRPRFWRR